MVATVPAIAQSADAPRMEITVGAGIRHDSNVARSSDGVANTRGLSRSDQRFTPEIAIDLYRPFARNTVELVASAGYDFFRRNTQLNRERIGIDGALGLRTGPCDTDLTIGLTRRQSDLGQIAFNAVDDRNIRNAETIQTYGAAIACGDAIGLRPIASISRQLGNNSNDLRQFSNFRSVQYGGGLEYTRPTFGSLRLRATRNEVAYPNRPSLTGAGDGFTFDRVGVEFTRDLGAVLTADASVYYSTLSAEQPGAEEFDGVTYAGALTATTTRWVLSAGFAREVAPTLQVDALYRVERNVNLGATYALTSAVSLTGTATYSARRYVNSGTSFGPLLTNDRRQIYGLAATFARSPRLRFILDGGYETRNANGSFYDYDNVFVGLRAITSF